METVHGAVDRTFFSSESLRRQVRSADAFVVVAARPRRDAAHSLAFVPVAARPRRAASNAATMPGTDRHASLRARGTARHAFRMPLVLDRATDPVLLQPPRKHQRAIQFLHAAASAASINGSVQMFKPLDRK